MNPKASLPLIAALLALMGCSCSQSGATPDNPYLAPGMHSLTLTAQVPAGQVVPVSGLQLTLALPPGVVLFTAPGSSAVQAASLKPLNAAAGTTLVDGNYQPDSSQLELAMIATPSGAWSGDFLRIQFLVLPESPVPVQSLAALNGTPLHCRVVGVDPVQHSSVDLSAQVVTTLRVD